ncbi:MAG: thioredoxin domain-containing protein [Planctomycetota bacterium]|nr:thioredoxin domain-containing protein [Planctomycetota bacterium]
MSFLSSIATVLLLGITSGKPSDFVVMQFTARWCEPCKEMQPAIEQLAQQGWVIRNVDVDLEKSIVQRMKVSHLPTLLILKNGRETDRITGVHTYPELAKLLSIDSRPAAIRSAPASQPEAKPFDMATSTLEPFPMLEANPDDSQLNQSQQNQSQLDRPNATFASQNASPSTSSSQSNIRAINKTNNQTSSSTALSPTAPLSQEATRPPVDPLSTTVRIKTEDESSMAYGTGTMIDQVNGEVLVITCGHLFRDLKPTTRIIVEAPVNGQLGQFAGTVIDYQCDETDIGLLSFKVGVDVSVARLLPRGTALREGESVASFGCDGGADPTRRDSHITKLNRYLGPSNVEVAKAPVQGRSGGGLFNQAGQLIGVCYAADKELDEGLYSGPEVVYSQLARLGLTRLYSEPSPANDTPTNNLANNLIARGGQPTPNLAPANPQTGTVASENLFPDQMRRDPRSQSRSDRNTQDWQQTVDQAAQLARSNASAIAAASASLVATSSITATIRDASGHERTISIPNPSPALMQMLEAPKQTAQLSSSPSSLGDGSVIR